MTSRTVRPASNILGALRLPGDKSISHRYAMLAGFANGRSVLHNFSTGADCASTLHCLHSVGVRVIHDSKSRDVTIEGRAGSFQQPLQPLDCGNSGSTMRMLAGLLAGQPIECELVGDHSLSRRPMARITEPLREMGANITARQGELAPLHIRGGRLHGIHHESNVPSAQVKTSLLFAGLQATGETSIAESVRTRDHGELALRAFGADLHRRYGHVTIMGPQSLHAIEAIVPGDVSSASFFLCAAAIFPDSNLVIEGVLMNPTRAALLDVMTTLGAQVKVLQLEEQHGELIGTIKIQSGQLRGALIEGAQSAALIDELPVLAAIAPYTEQGIEIRDARELRVKESDRIALVAQNLRAMGAVVHATDDGMWIEGSQTLHGAEIESGGDHRIAMAFTIAALRAQGDSVIHGADAAAISFPEFYDLLESVLER